jgi:hypothetical protein
MKNLENYLHQPLAATFVVRIPGSLFLVPFTSRLPVEPAPADGFWSTSNQPARKLFFL